MRLSDFSLLKEDASTYVIGHPKGKSMQISKQGMSHRAKELVSKLRRVQHFAGGGKSQDADTTIEAVDPTELPMGEVPQGFQKSNSNQWTPPLDQPEKSVLTGGLDPNDVPPAFQKSNPNQWTALDQPQDSVAIGGLDPTKMPMGEVPLAFQNANQWAPPPQDQSQENGSMGALEPSTANAPMQSAASALPSENVADQKKPNIYDKAIGDLNRASAAQQKAGKETASGYEDANLANYEAWQDYLKRKKTLDEQGDKLFQAAYEGKIDPDRYLNNMSTGSKIASIFGLVLSGMGSGLSHSPNLAADYLFKSISNDIDAQKNDQSRTANLWKMNREALGSDTLATLTTQSQMLNMAKAKAMQAQASAQGAEAKARFAPLVLQINQAKELSDERLAFSQMMREPAPKGGRPMDPAVLVPRFVPKEQQGKVFEEIKIAQNTKKMKANILKSFDDTIADIRAHPYKKYFKTPRASYALHQALMPTFSEIDKSSTDNTVKNTFKDVTPSEFDNEDDFKTRRVALENYIDSKSSAPISKGYGIDLSQFNSTNSYNDQSHPYKSKNIVHDKKNDKYWELGPDGKTLAMEVTKEGNPIATQ